jgi:hypothetical protein
MYVSSSAGFPLQDDRYPKSSSHYDSGSIEVFALAWRIHSPALLSYRLFASSFSKKLMVSSLTVPG